MTTDTYDAQIEVLLAHNWDEFGRLVNRRLSAKKFRSHFSAWDATGTSLRSLFAYLPGCMSCPSTIEGRRVTNIEMKAAVLKDAKIMLSGRVVQNCNFTRAELEEFARRQRVARGIER